MIARLFNLIVTVVVFPFALLLYMNRSMIGFMIGYVKASAKLIRNPV